jgi:hypothetical protein
MTPAADGPLDASVAAARRALGVDASSPARAWRVERLSAGAGGYLLVVFGAPHVTVVAALDAESGEVLESARLPVGGAHALIDAEEAIRRADVGAGAAARLVWEPSGATRSRFYPLWEIRRGGHVVWVDGVRGVVFTSLESSSGGG